MRKTHTCVSDVAYTACVIKPGGNPSPHSDIVIRGNDFLTGCLDKNQIGASAEGIVHSVFESYGAHKAGLLLTIFGRLFTHFQQVLSRTLLVCRVQPSLCTVR